MPWKEVSMMSQREEFVILASCEDANMAALCRGFRISRKTGYKWRERYRQEGREGLGERSRRPRCSPQRTSDEFEQQVIALRRQHPAWGGRKLRRRLQDLGQYPVPAASTITEILRRHALLDGDKSSKHQAYQRFEHAAPNDLWQMDFKGDFALTRGGRCHPLTVLDDHSRFSIGLRACSDETRLTVQRHLIDLFRQYGMPRRMLMDNGSPWGDGADNPYTGLTVWLIRLGVSVSHGRAYHPQTQGKDERFHRTLIAELLSRRSFADVPDSQRGFDPWRDVYNLQRPHEALSLAVPASRYRVSGRSFPEVLPPVAYASGVQVRRAQSGGVLSFRGRRVRVGRAFRGEPVGFTPSEADGVWDVWYCHERIGQIDFQESGSHQLGTLPLQRRRDR